MGNREIYERLRAAHKHSHNESYASNMNDIENGIKHDPKRFFDFANHKRKTVGYPSSRRYDTSINVCRVDICELFADLFEGVYNDDTCGSVAGDMSTSSDGCGVEAAISGLDANKGPGNDDVAPSFVTLCADGLKSRLLHI
jgi:hypothetical protein